MAIADGIGDIKAPSCESTTEIRQALQQIILHLRKIATALDALEASGDADETDLADHIVAGH